MSSALSATSPWLEHPEIRSARREKRLEAGEILFRTGDKPPGLVEVVEGRIKLVRNLASGREVTLYSAGPGDLVAEASLFAAQTHCDAVAREASLVHVYPRMNVLRSIAGANQDEGALWLTTRLANQVISLRTRLETLQIRSARDRITRHILLAGDASGRLSVEIGGLRTIAAEIGLSPEAFYRALARLERDQMVIRLPDGLSLTSKASA